MRCNIQISHQHKQQELVQQHVDVNETTSKSITINTTPPQGEREHVSEQVQTKFFFCFYKPKVGILSTVYYEKVTFMMNFPDVYCRVVIVVRPKETTFRVRTEVFVCSKWAESAELSLQSCNFV